MNRKDRHFKYRPQRKMKFNQLFVLCFFLFVIFDGTSSQFFGRRTRRRVSVQGVKSLGGHFASLCRGVDFYEVKKKLLLFFKKKMEMLLCTLLIIL